MASSHMPDVGAEIEIPLEDRQEPRGSSGRLWWQEAGMESVREIVQEIPEWTGAVKELMEGA
jgi:hypothetical protein